MGLSAQTGEIPRHGVSFELLGPGISYSFNYEYFLHRNPFLRCSARTGINLIQGNQDPLTPNGSVVPIALNTLFFKGKHHFELDFGAMVYFFYGKTTLPEDRMGVFPMISPAYRFMPEKRSIFFKASLTPWYFPQPIAKDQFLYWPGLAVGYGF